MWWSRTVSAMAPSQSFKASSPNSSRRHPLQQRNLGLRAIGGQRVEIAGRCDQLLGDPVLLALHLEQHLQQLGRRADSRGELRLVLGLRTFAVRYRHAARDRFQKRRPHRALGQPFAETARARQFGHRGRMVEGDFQQCVVPQHVVARQVAGPRLALAPGGDFPQDRKKARLRAAHLDPVECQLGRQVVGLVRRKGVHLFAQPRRAPVLAEPLFQLLIDDPKVGHIGERVVDLLVAQRPGRPVGKARRLVDLRPGQLACQRFVAGGVAESADHRGDLGVEDRRGQSAGQVVEDFQVLARGMKHLENRGVRHQIHDRRQVDAGRKGIHGDGPIRARELHETKARPERALAHELGIDRNEFRAANGSAKIRQGFVVDNQRHGTVFYTYFFAWQEYVDVQPTSGASRGRRNTILVPRS